MKPRFDMMDFIILGSGLGGLVAGTLLSREKRSVLLLKEKKPPPLHSKKGYRFIPFTNFSERRINPSLVPSIPWAFIPLLRNYQKVWSEKNPEQRMAFQVILPKARVDVVSEPSLLASEWKREFPNEVFQIENFYSKMEHLLIKVRSKGGPQSLFFLKPRSPVKKWIPFNISQNRKTNEVLSPLSREFNEFIKLQLISWGNLFSDKFPAPLCAYLLNDGPNVQSQTMDIEALEQDLLREFLQSGGRIEEVEEVEKVTKKWKKGFIVSLGKDQGTYRSRSLILNFPLYQSINLFDKRWKGLSVWAKRIVPRYLFFPVFLGIRERVVPVGMKDLLVSILDLEKPYEGGNVLFLSLSPRGDETKAPEGRRALTVESLMPFGKLDQDFLAKHQNGVMRHLKHLFPFLENYVEFVDWNWVEEQLPNMPYSRILHEAISDFDWQQGIVPSRILRNLFFVGKESFPYLGMEGEILSALRVVQMILKKHSSS